MRRALELILGAEKLEDLKESGLTALFREHQSRGQIEFVTFHQSYGYEEFVEGIRPVLETEGGEVRYELHHGVFKRIALRAAAEGLVQQPVAPGFDELWSHLIQQVQQEDGRVAQSQSGKNYVLRVTPQNNLATYQCTIDEDGNVAEITDKRQVASCESARLYWEHRNELGPEPEKLSYEKTTALFARTRGGSGGNHYTALWIVYSQLLGLSRSAVGRKQEIIDPIARVQQALDRPSAGAASFSFSAATRQFVLVIDEINRGNVSKILGELITLLEPDKRLGAASELKLPLSYSPQHRFAVPPNLHVLGTMNTADRSIALMDVALRRRFSFEELMPDAAVLRDLLQTRTQDSAFVELVVELFQTMNDRIRFLYDRDHQLGHSYFLEATDLERLRQVFVGRVLTLLQEYFYGAWDKICTVLGCPYDESGEAVRRERHLLDPRDGRKHYKAPVVRAHPFPDLHTLGFQHDDSEERFDYAVDKGFHSSSADRKQLVCTFLGVLNLDPEAFEHRLAELLGPLLPAPPEPALEPFPSEAPA